MDQGKPGCNSASKFRCRITWSCGKKYVLENLHHLKKRSRGKILSKRWIMLVDNWALLISILLCLKLRTNWEIRDTSKCRSVIRNPCGWYLTLIVTTHGGARYCFTCHRKWILYSKHDSSNIFNV